MNFPISISHENSQILLWNKDPNWVSGPTSYYKATWPDSSWLGSSDVAAASYLLQKSVMKFIQNRPSGPRIQERFFGAVQQLCQLVDHVLWCGTQVGSIHRNQTLDWNGQSHQQPRSNVGNQIISKWIALRGSVSTKHAGRLLPGATYLIVVWNMAGWSLLSIKIGMRSWKGKDTINIGLDYSRVSLIC